MAAAKAHLVDEMAEHLDHEAEGYSSPKAWLRDQLRLDPGDAHDLVNAARTLRDLPDLDRAASQGETSAKHTKLFTHAIKQVGLDQTASALEYLLPVAQHSVPADLKATVTRLREAVYPDSLEQAWIDGMAKSDVRLTPVPEGYHLTGFLDVETGLMFSTWLTSAGTPRVENDDRSSAERRMDALRSLLRGVLAHGLPTDNGVRPHVSLTVDLTDLVAHPDTATAEAAGFGTLAPGLMRRLLETADLTPILTAGRSAVLDVGRRFRFATEKQKRAIDARQRGQCAEHGCRNPIDHYHHTVRWVDGGLTDLDSMIGVCHRTHIDLHRGLLEIDPQTLTTRRTITPRRRRRSKAA